jgi:RNA polymerase sigma-70 factor (ECF subfamily)
MGAEPRGELIRRWQRGDPAAFEELVRAWEGPIGRFLYRMTRSVETARDLVQETFARLHSARHSYRDQGHFSTWLYRIALNLARDEARRNRRRFEPLPDVEMAGNEPLADDGAERNETAAIVSAALADLPPTLREVVLLRHYEGFRFEAMARVLGVPASTLKSRFAVAIGQLTERLTARGLRPEEDYA